MPRHPDVCAWGMRNALNDLRNQRIASGGYTDAADAALANLLRAKVPFHLFGHMR